MNTKLTNEAERLASQSYVTYIQREVLPGGTPVFVAYNPDLEGCVAQGDTLAEAKNDLSEVRRKYILHLLEHGLPVPGPSTSKETASFGLTYVGRIDFENASTVADYPLKPIEQLSYRTNDSHTSHEEYSPSSDTLVQVA